MKKERVNAFINLSGILGIIGSLLFVGLEMRQSQRIAIAGQYYQSVDERSFNPSSNRSWH